MRKCTSLIAFAFTLTAALVSVECQTPYISGIQQPPRTPSDNMHQAPAQRVSAIQDRDVEGMVCEKIEVAEACTAYDYGHHKCARRTPVWQMKNVAGYFFVSKLAVDVDGSPHAYHPADKKPPDNHTASLDWLANISASDLHGIQGISGVGPAQGFFVSGTTLENNSFRVNDVHRYVNAEEIPYLVIPSHFPKVGLLELKPGDTGVVEDLKTGAISAAIFADTGNAVGEASLKLAENLRIDVTNPRFPPKVAGQERSEFLYIVFPSSRVSPPWATTDIHRTALGRFQTWGGTGRVKACFREQAQRFGENPLSQPNTSSDAQPHTARLGFALKYSRR